MGNHASDAMGNKHTKTRSSIHSAKFYLPPTPTSPTSVSYDSSCADLKENLPDEMKAYTNSIQTVYYFWCSEIETLDEGEYKEAAVLFYMHVFKAIPKARPLFTKSIELQAKQFFGMFRWLITNLSQPDSQRLVSKIKILGSLHQKMNIQPEWYTLFLHAFHETMHETVMEKYTSRVRFCMEQLYTMVMNIMLNRDFEALAHSKMGAIIKCVDKLEDCLFDQEANIYLELYMREQFCVELFLFLREHRRFKSCVSDFQRKHIGEAMMKKYVDQYSECEINVSYGAKQRIYTSLKENGNSFVIDVFDECAEECRELIQTNVWNGFKQTIMKMAVNNESNTRKPTPPLLVPVSTSTEASVSAVSFSTSSI